MMIPFWVKLLVLGLVVSAIFGAGFKGGYGRGYASATADMQEKVDGMKKSLEAIRVDFETYKSEQSAKLRKIEDDSKMVADEALKRADAFRKKAEVAQSGYAKLLSERKEVPSTLSTSSFDTINILVNDWEATTP